MTCVKAVKMMKEAVEKAGLKAHYMVQPLAFHTPDCNCQGFIDLPEFPFGSVHHLHKSAITTKKHGTLESEMKSSPKLTSPVIYP